MVFLFQKKNASSRACVKGGEDDDLDSDGGDGKRLRKRVVDGLKPAFRLGCFLEFPRQRQRIETKRAGSTDVDLVRMWMLLQKIFVTGPHLPGSAVTRALADVAFDVPGTFPDDRHRVSDVHHALARFAPNGNHDGLLCLGLGLCWDEKKERYGHDLLRRSKKDGTNSISHLDLE